MSSITDHWVRGFRELGLRSLALASAGERLLALCHPPPISAAPAAAAVVGVKGVAGEKEYHLRPLLPSRLSREDPCATSMFRLHRRLLERQLPSVQCTCDQQATRRRHSNVLLTLACVRTLTRVQVYPQHETQETRTSAAGVAADQEGECDKASQGQTQQAAACLSTRNSF